MNCFFFAPHCSKTPTTKCQRNRHAVKTRYSIHERCQWVIQILLKIRNLTISFNRKNACFCKLSFKLGIYIFSCPLHNYIRHSLLEYFVIKASIKKIIKILEVYRFLRDEAGTVYKTRYFDNDSDLPLRYIETPAPDSITFNSRGFVVGTLIPVDVGRRNRAFRVTMNALGRTQINKHP